MILKDMLLYFAIFAEIIKKIQPLISNIAVLHPRSVDEWIPEMIGLGKIIFFGTWRHFGYLAVKFQGHKSLL